jgi:Flp pilus assembly protein TadG
MNTGSTGTRTVVRHKPRRADGFRARLTRRKSERGYIMVTTIIMLPLLLVLVSAATDVTYFYARTVEVQRLADTAALAGVVRMPNLPDAQKIAQRVATQNGAKNGESSMTVNAEPIVGTNRKLKVTVRDANVKLFFGSLFKDHWDIQRTSTAEYVSNIPLGSVLNAIGTGDISGATDPVGVGKGHAATPQNFWLTAHGPCAAKEQGDQLSTRYDGTFFNFTPALATSHPEYRYRRVCDFNAAQLSLATPAAVAASQIAQLESEIAASPTDLFPAVSLNRDYDSQGYNYIVDVPCAPAPDGTVYPAPCTGANLTTTTELSIDMFDPVFGPDSLQRFQFRGGVLDQRKPDSYGVRKVVTPGCTTAAITAAQLALAPDPLASCKTPIGPGEVLPADVRVFTQVRVYPPDDSPVDYSNDIPMPLTDPRNRTTGIAPNGAVETDAVALFKTCVNATDEWMSDVAGVLAPMTDTNNDYVPDVAGTETPIPADSPDRDSYCADNSLKWRSIIKLPAGSKRGRYRINVRTISSNASFGSNAFAIRASFGTEFVGCSSVSAATCPSVSGDSAMSVFASVPGVSEFYLAQLAPAQLFRGKTVVLQLWDIGEGGDSIEVLRPISGASQCSTGVDSDPNYCIQKFNWNVWDPGINNPGANALKPAGDARQDNCKSVGQEGQTKLSVAGDWNTKLTALGCGSTLPSDLLDSRAGFGDSNFIKTGAGTATGACADLGSPAVTGVTTVQCKAGLFNDRLVALQVEVPLNYGCKAGTGPDPVTGNVASPCEDVSPIPQGGWWRIRYTPLKEDPSPLTPYLRMTDATTWTVQLLGDPVHLVPND